MNFPTAKLLAKNTVFVTFRFRKVAVGVLSGV